MGMYHRGGTPVVIKELLVARGPPPPPQPHLNKVYDRVIDQGTAFELRQLCDRGEFFDMLLEEHQVTWLGVGLGLGLGLGFGLGLDVLLEEHQVSRPRA